ncbi:hypothetical protein SH449x_003027 [Pirellulaceae bacterium SH449]
MSTRVEKFEQLYKALKKHLKFNEVSVERTVLEHMLYACCLEDSRSEQADEAFAKLQQSYFDWNEVRVTTTIELSDILSALPNAATAGHRIKRCLQSMFETRYQFDLEDLKKANLGKATEELQAWQGMTQFVLNYTSQHALGGHAIPVDSSTVDVLWAAGILSDSEAEKKSVTGLERAIPKNKGEEFGSLLHQFAVEYSLNKKHAASLAVFKELGVTPKAKPAAAEATASPTKSKTASASKSGAGTTSKDGAKSSAKESAASPKDAFVAEKKDAAATDTADAASKASSKKSGDSKAPGKKDSPKQPAPDKAPKPAAKGADKDTAKVDDKKSVSKLTSKSESGKTPSSKSPAAKPATPKGKPPAEKAASGKAATEKSKSTKKPEKQPETKKASAAPKKPAKMANNVKITKKKPK